MAKGDAQRVQNTVDYQGNLAQNNLNNQRGQLQDQYNNLWWNFNNSLPGAQQDYNNIMGNYQKVFDTSAPVQAPTTDFGNEYAGYQNLAGGGGSVGLAHGGDIDAALAGYKNFAQTGGFSPNDLADLRARAISPTRAVYANAQANIDRQRALQGGYSPNYTAASAKLARDVSQGISDANVNANASIAQAVQQGKLAGLTGMSTTALAAASAQAQVDQINNQMRLAGLGGMTDIDKARLSSELTQQQLNIASRGQQLQAAGGMAGLYGATPGMAGMFGNMVLNTGNQLNTSQGQQNQLSDMLINGQLGRAAVPSSTEKVLGYVKTGSEIAKNVGGMIAGMGA